MSVDVALDSIPSACFSVSFPKNRQPGAVIFAGLARLRYGTEGDVQELLRGIS
jgi:hypothetical protein